MSVFYRFYMFLSTKSLSWHIGYTVQGRTRDLVKKSLEQNQIDNKKEGELITRRESNGSAMPKLDGSRGR